MNSLRIARIAAPTLALCSLASVATAQQIFLDQQPSQSFSLFSTLGLEANADNFVVTDPNGIAINTIRLWGTWAPAGVSVADTFDVVFHGNDSSGPFGDVPGATLTTYPALAPTVTATSGMFPTASGLLPEYLVQISLPAPMMLTPGTYWVEVYSTASTGAADTFTWEMAPQDLMNGGMCMSWSSTTPGTTWNACTPFPETDLALVLSNETTTIGTTYCSPAVSNSTGNPGVLSASGSANAATNNVTLTAESMPFNAFGFFLTSMSQGFVANPGGSTGNLCLGGSIGRYVGPGQIQNSGSAGAISLSLDLTQMPTPTGFVAVQPGDTWNFTTWHRDMGAMGAATSNFTDGVEITFN